MVIIIIAIQLKVFFSRNADLIKLSFIIYFSAVAKAATKL
jgi:hypothetical protein